MYVAGVEYNGTTNVAKLWKNGVAQNLTDGTMYAYAYSVFVEGNDVYVAGFEDNSSNVYVAKVWKNGTAQDLTNGTNYAIARSVYVSNGDVYVVGREETATTYVATLWKNGIPQVLSDGTNNAVAYSVFIDDGQLSVDEMNDIQNPISFYPNPVKNKAYFETVEPVQKVILYDVTGKNVKEVKLNSTTGVISLEELIPGIYFAEIYAGKSIQKVKFIKQ